LRIKGACFEEISPPPDFILKLKLLLDADTPSKDVKMNKFFSVEVIIGKHIFLLRSIF
jgi:hypothetical protein